MNSNYLEELLGFNPKSSSNKLYALCDFKILKKTEISFVKFLEI